MSGGYGHLADLADHDAWSCKASQARALRHRRTRSRTSSKPLSGQAEITEEMGVHNRACRTELSEVLSESAHVITLVSMPAVTSGATRDSSSGTGTPARLMA
ncbi:MAG: hypothetical protein U5K74_13055 [Gemmatimonadaceae bacterium]|nr:hypothetical protein [Gemmatimonadaceae bacterium]